MLRRDMRRTAAARPQGSPVEAATTAPLANDAPVVETPASDTAVVETPVSDTPVVATPASDTAVVDTPVSDTPVVETPVSDTPAADIATPATGTDAPPRRTGRDPHRPDPRPRHRAAAAHTAAHTPRRPRATKRRWVKTKTLGATLAIGVLVTGAALPALNPLTDQSAASAVSALAGADGVAQSYTPTGEIRTEISAREGFSATTPEEVKETRSRAAAAAIAAGMPLGSALDIPTADRIMMPMAAGSYTLTDGFGASRPGRSHLGQDFAAPVGTPITAAMKGCVSRSTESYQGYGVTIQIETIVDGQAVSTVYSHMVYGSRAVEVGDCVEAGQYIGDVGSTGYVFGSCLHFEVHINTVAVDPKPWLAKNVNA